MFKPYSASTGDKAKIAAAQDSAQDLKKELTYMSSELERVLLINEALWEFIRDDQKLEDKDLHRKIIDIDARDGNIDGKVTPSELKKCSECGHTLPRKKPYCFFCGTRIVKGPFER